MIIGGQFIVAAIIIILDYRWIEMEMSKPEWNGAPDMDFVFYIGVLIRIVIINSVLLTVTGIGYFIKKRLRRAMVSLPSVEI